MKSIYNNEKKEFNIENLISSINRLKPDSKPNWGVMNCSQMLKHCNRQAKLYCNEYKTSYKSFFLANTLGKIHLFYLKYIIQYDINKYKKNSRGLSFLNTSNIENIDFEEEKNKLIKRLKFVYNFEPEYVSTPIHGKVRNETFKKNIFVHVKYHLNQFNAL